jgi:predicted DNA-binding transcriptional regulator YafY
MDFITYQKKMEHLKFLIAHNMVKTANDIASRLEVSPRTAYRIISRLKDSGTFVKFCRYSKSYKFSDEG